MEEMREAASAYYANLSDDKKKLATELFRAMDKQGDGKVSLKEYTAFFKEKGVAEITNPDIFKALDADGNGNLDFDEFITVYYVYMGDRMLFCKQCKTFLNAIYFTCVHCFDDSDHTYDLCSACFRFKKFQHHEDATFLDNYTLLRCKRNVEKHPVNPNLEPEDSSTQQDAENIADDIAEERAMESAGKVRKGGITRFAAKIVPPKLVYGMTKNYAKSITNTSEMGSNVTAKTSSQLSKIGDKIGDAISSCNPM